jgi:hypothetical protein
MECPTLKLVERLRTLEEWFVYEGMPERSETVEDAVDRIEALEATLREVEKMGDAHCRLIARAALSDDSAAASASSATSP